MISVIIATFNKNELLDKTLAGFCIQSFRDFELILVNDGGQEQTGQFVTKYREKLNIKYTRLAENLGRAEARNYALRESQGNIIVITDDDRIPEPDYLKSIQDNIEPNVYLVGYKHEVLTFWRKGELSLSENNYRMLFNNQLLDFKHIMESEVYDIIDSHAIMNNFDQFLSKTYLNEAGDNFLGIFDLYGEKLKNFHYPWLFGTFASVAFKKDALEQIGFIDNNFEKGWGFEDTEFCYRLFRSGYRMKFCKNMKNYHQIHPIGKENLPLVVKYRIRDKSMFTNLLYFCKKYDSLDLYVLFKGLIEGKWFPYINNNFMKMRNLNDGLKEEVLSLYRNYVKIYHN